MFEDGAVTGNNQGSVKDSPLHRRRLPGLGQLEQGALRYAHDAVSADVLGLVRQLALKGVVLAGHPMGKVAQLVAAPAPEGLTTLALIARKTAVFRKDSQRAIDINCIRISEVVMFANIKVPDSSIVRQAEELVRSVSNDVLFNHVMRCYWFGELFAYQQGEKVDSELMFLSSVLHDLGLTGHAPGPHRFEIEGAGAARTFLVERGVPVDRAQMVWDNIALHTWDMNLFRSDTSRFTQLGLAYDVSGVAGAQLDAADVAVVVQRYPRLNFKRVFNEMLEHEVDTKQPYQHWFHICSRIAHNRSPLTIVGAPTVLNWAPFDE